jgi:hypothetical protein
MGRMVFPCGGWVNDRWARRNLRGLIWAPPPNEAHDESSSSSSSPLRPFQQHVPCSSSGDAPVWCCRLSRFGCRMGRRARQPAADRKVMMVVVATRSQPVFPPAIQAKQDATLCVRHGHDEEETNNGEC